jgi:Putative transmembrane protein (PGPGW)
MAHAPGRSSPVALAGTAPAMPPTRAALEPQPRSAPLSADDGLGQPAEAPKGALRDRVRAKPGIGHAYRVGVFVLGLLCIALGFALAVLPGPLTIPPILLGLWIWSTEFRFAERFFDSFKRKAEQAWIHAKVHPISSALITVAGLAAAGVAMWAVSHYELVAKGKDAIGV